MIRQTTSPATCAKLFIGLIIATSFVVSAAADEWALRKQETSNVCHVQRTTASPLGKLMSKHSTQKAACTEAKRVTDPELQDKSKCWTFGGGTVTSCANDGVVLNFVQPAANMATAFTMQSPSIQQNSKLTPFVIGGAPADPAKFRATLIFSGTLSCSSTIVGQKAVLTAAHCVNNGATGTIEVGGNIHSVTCTHHADYVASPACTGAGAPLSCTADVALCASSSNLTSSGLKYEVVQTDRSKIKVGDPIVLIGYGCTVDGKQDFGTLFIGSSKVSKLSKVPPSTFDDYYLQLNQLALACKGDSGAGNFDQTDPSTRFVIGVTSRGSATFSKLVQTTDKRIVDFMKEWAKQNAAPICGVTPGATGCR